VEMGWSGPDNAVANNICYCQVTGDTTSVTSLAALGTVFSSAWAVPGNIMSYLSSEWSITDISVSDYSGLSENFARDTTAIPGTLSGSGNSPNVAFVVGWQIAARYRGGHPRWYIPGVLPATLTTPGGRHIDPAHQGGLQSSFATFLSQINASTSAFTGVHLGTISFFSNCEFRPTPLFRAFSNPLVASRLGSQRRRLGKETPTH
jgi:hypothetical protein